MGNVSDAVEQVSALADRLTDPKVMTRSEYGEFLDEILSRFEGNKDAYDSEESAEEDEDD